MHLIDIYIPLKKYCKNIKIFNIDSFGFILFKYFGTEKILKIGICLPFKNKITLLFL